MALAGGNGDHLTQMHLIFQKLQGIKTGIYKGESSIGGRSLWDKGIEIELPSAKERDAFAEELRKLGLSTKIILRDRQPSLSISLSEEEINRYAKDHPKYQEEFPIALALALAAAKKNAEAAQAQSQPSLPQKPSKPKKRVRFVEDAGKPLVGYEPEKEETEIESDIEEEEAPEESDFLLEVIPPPRILHQHEQNKPIAKSKLTEVMRNPNQSYADLEAYLKTLEKENVIGRKLPDPKHGILDFNTNKKLKGYPHTKSIELDILGTNRKEVKAYAYETTTATHPELLFSIEKGKMDDDEAVQNICDLAVASAKPNAVLEVSKGPRYELTIAALNVSLKKYQDKFPLGKDGKPTLPTIKKLGGPAPKI